MADASEQLQNALEVEPESKYKRWANIVTNFVATEKDKIIKNLNRQSTLIPEQIFGVEAAAEFVNKVENRQNNKIALIVAPPGSGKTGMVALLFFYLRSQRVLIITPSLIISDQIYKALSTNKMEENFFIKCRFPLQPRHIRNMLEVPFVPKSGRDLDEIGEHNLVIKNACDPPTVIVNAQKFSGRNLVLGRAAAQTPQQVLRREQLEMFDTVIVDEAHHYPAKTWVSLVDCFQGKKVVFLTGTPFKGQLNSEVPLEKNPQVSLVYEVKRENLEGKYIRKVEFVEKVNPYPNFSQDFYAKVRQDIEQIFKAQRKEEPRAGWSPKAMILLRTKKETEAAVTALGNDYATFVHSGAKKNLEKFNADNGIKAVAVCGMLKEGYDDANVTVVVILRNCGGRVLFEQFAGRCTRINRSLDKVETSQPDRVKAVVLSYAQFQQQKMWDASHSIAVEDPVDDFEAIESYIDGLF